MRALCDEREAVLAGKIEDARAAWNDIMKYETKVLNDFIEEKK